MKPGDLIKIKNTERFATVVRGVYTYRFMDAQDYEMEAHGMGHLAGSYGGAFDVVFMDNGLRHRIAVSSRNFEVVKSNADA